MLTSPRHAHPAASGDGSGTGRATGRTRGVLRSAAAVSIGLVGPLASFHGWGVARVPSWEVSRGQVVIVASAIAWAACSAALLRLRRRGAPGFVSEVVWALALIAVTAVAMTGTASNVGRAPAVVAVGGTALALLVLRDWGLVGGWAPERRPMAILPLVPLAGAEVAWGWLDARPATGTLLLACASMVVAWCARPRAAEAADRRVVAAWSSVGRRVGALWRRSGRGTSALVDRHGAAAVAAVAVGALWSPVLWRLCNGPPKSFVLGIDDYPRHLLVARNLQFFPLRIGVPHLLFHVLSRALTPPLGTRLAPVVVLAAATALAVLATRWLLVQPAADGTKVGRTTATVVAVGYFLSETPALILHELGVVGPHEPYLTIHWWGNPTWLMGLPFLILLLPLLDAHIAAVESGRSPSRAARTTLVVTVVLGALAKPSFLVCLVPVLPFYLLLVRRGSRRVLVSTTLLVLIPAAAVMGWQTWYLGSKQSPEFNSGWTFDPIVQPAFGWHRAGPVFWIPLIVVLWALVVTRGRFLRESSVQLVLSCMVVALPLMLCVRETGVKAADGNMAVPMQACTTLLVLLALRTCVRSVQRRWRSAGGRSRATPSLVISAGLALLFLAGGALSYLDAVQVVQVPTDWQTVARPR